MRSFIWLPLVMLLMAVPAAAEQKGARAAIGYTVANYLEEGGGSAPLGFFASVASTAPVAFEGELAYHRDSEELTFLSSTLSITLHTLTGMIGGRFQSDEPGAQPFGRILVGPRYDWIESSDNWSFGFDLGGGVDIAAGPRMFVRLGVDYQMFFDEGENVKILRVNAGLAF